MQYPYQPLEPGIPQAPIIPVQLTRPDWQTPFQSATIAAFLDTGSDCTLVPLAVIAALQLQISRSSAIIQGSGGLTALICRRTPVSSAIRKQLQEQDV